MSKLVNKSTVGQKLLIARRVDDKSTKVQIYLNPQETYEFKENDLMGSSYLTYYRALRAIGIHFIEDDKEVETSASTKTPKVDNPVTTTNTETTSEASHAQVVSEGDKAAMIGYLESTYNKSKLIEFANEAGCETWGTKSEIATRIVEANSNMVETLMQG